MLVALLLVLVAHLPAARAACDPELAALELAICELDGTREATLCGPVAPPLETAADAVLARGADALRSAAGSVSTRRRRKLLRRVDRLLRRIPKRAARLRRRDLVSVDCEAAITERVGRLRELVAGNAGSLPGLPGLVAEYPGWLRLNRQPIGPRPGGDAHSGTKNVFVNQARTALAPDGTPRFPYPDGTIVVKESTRPGTDFVWLVAVMRKRAGSDPRHGDWTFTEYTRDGASERFALSARDGVCFGCHAVAIATDWVYTLLE